MKHHSPGGADLAVPPGKARADRSRPGDAEWLPARLAALRHRCRPVGGGGRAAGRDRLRPARRISPGRRAVRVDAADGRLRRLWHVTTTDRQSRRRHVRDGGGDRRAARRRRRRALHEPGDLAGGADGRGVRPGRIPAPWVPRRLPRQAGARRLHERDRHQHRPRPDRQGVRLCDRVGPDPASTLRVRRQIAADPLANARRWRRPPSSSCAACAAFFLACRRR